MSSEIDYFGEFLMKHFRDVALECADGLCDNKYDSPNHRKFQDELQSLSEAQKALLKRTLGYCLDGAMNDFLFHLD
jgi:hypothetical protein